MHKKIVYNKIAFTKFTKLLYNFRNYSNNNTIQYFLLISIIRQYLDSILLLIINTSNTNIELKYNTLLYFSNFIFFIFLNFATLIILKELVSSHNSFFELKIKNMNLNFYFSLFLISPLIDITLILIKKNTISFIYSISQNGQNIINYSVSYGQVIFLTTLLFINIQRNYPQHNLKKMIYYALIIPFIIIWNLLTPLIFSISFLQIDSIDFLANIDYLRYNWHLLLLSFIVTLGIFIIKILNIIKTHFLLTEKRFSVLLNFIYLLFILIFIIPYNFELKIINLALFSITTSIYLITIIYFSKFSPNTL